MSNIDSNYCYSFPAVRGYQAGRALYIATCPLRTIPKIFIFDEEEVPPELRAQRTLNTSRIPEMVRYLVDNPKDYIFSAITVSVGTEVLFEAHDNNTNLGTLKVPLDAQILINDGQHRRKAIEEAIKENPDLGHDNIPVLFFVDEGLKRSQQMFADLNKYAVKPSPSLATLYDKRDQGSELARVLSTQAFPFKGYTEMEKSSISAKSAKLFTLSSIKQSTRAFLGLKTKEFASHEQSELAKEFWQAVHYATPEWQMIHNRELSPSLFRQDFINAHGLGLHAIGVAGKALIEHYPDDWQERIIKLKEIDWRKSNPTWRNRSMLHNKLSKAATNIQLTANVLKQVLEIPLTEHEVELEKQIES